eukprot:jgi/Bigna1/147625/aug1.248_g22333
MDKTLTFVTGNKHKLAEVQAILKGVVDCTNKKLDLPEMQGEPVEVSQEKCKLAVEEIKGPTIVEDTSLCFNALGGLPGVYIKWFLKKLGHDGLNKMLSAYEDKCIFCYCEGPGKEIVEFVGRCPGKIVPARGPTDFGWDPVFEPDESKGETFAEMDKQEKNKISHR